MIKIIIFNTMYFLITFTYKSYNERGKYMQKTIFV